MQSMIFFMEAYLIIAGLSLLGIGFIIVWDWFFWRRLPYVRWLKSRIDDGEISRVRELTRLRRRRPR